MTDSALTPATSQRIAQPWLSSAAWDGLWIVAPAFISSFFVLAFKQQMENAPHLPLWGWVCFVLLVDVAHVYATLFRTYLDPKALSKNSGLLIGIPLVCWATGAMLYSIDALLFWRVLAYLAVFHFIRQQYGFMALYSRKEPDLALRFRWLDAAIIYCAAIYPLLFWHTHLPRNFTWFVDGDFVASIPGFVSEFGLAVYAILAMFYIAKEGLLLRQTGFFNIPRNLIIIGTAVSWWAGIVSVNSDLAFTMTNVITHGIPYMALVWFYAPIDRNKNETECRRDAGAPAAGAPMQRLTRLALTCAPIFFAFLALLAYCEEGLWDGLIWREHLNIFPWFWNLPEVFSPLVLTFLIPFLSLPQSTHYVLDGFIWRVKDRLSVWSV